MPRKIALQFDATANRYRMAATGRFVARSNVVSVVDALVEDSASYLRNISKDFTDGKLSLGEWQQLFADRLRAGHTLSAAIALGGKENVSLREWGRIGAFMREQYKYLQRFALQIEAGGRINFGRVNLYARAVRNTFLNAERLRMKKNQKARWVLNHARESCTGIGSCTEQASRGVQYVRDFPLFGTRTCIHNCTCDFRLID